MAGPVIGEKSLAQANALRAVRFLRNAGVRRGGLNARPLTLSPGYWGEEGGVNLLAAAVALGELVGDFSAVGLEVGQEIGDAFAGVGVLGEALLAASFVGVFAVGAGALFAVGVVHIISAWAGDRIRLALGALLADLQFVGGVGQRQGDARAPGGHVGIYVFFGERGDFVGGVGIKTRLGRGGGLGEGAIQDFANLIVIRARRLRGGAGLRGRGLRSRLLGCRRLLCERGRKDRDRKRGDAGVVHEVLVGSKRRHAYRRMAS